MNLHALKWRKVLLGSADNIYQLRTIKLATPDVDELPLDEINRDLHRTFPTDKYYVAHIDRIRNILLWYAYTNTAVPYCQCFSFLAFVLYRVFNENDKRHAMIDTYYCMHKMILIIKPLLPKSATDAQPLKFQQTLESVILLDIMKEDRKLYEQLKNKFLVKAVIANGVSSFFLNWFSFHKCSLLIDYIVDTKASIMFQRLLNFTVAFFLVHRSLFLRLTEDKCLVMLNEKQIFNFYSILWKAKNLDLLL